MADEAMLAAEQSSSFYIDQAQFTAMMFLDEGAPMVRVSLQSLDPMKSTFSVNIESSVASGEWVQHAALGVVVAAQSLGSAALSGVTGPYRFAASTGCYSAKARILRTGAALVVNEPGNRHLAPLVSLACMADTWANIGLAI